jgi:hypothetical protein
MYRAALGEITRKNAARSSIFSGHAAPETAPSVGDLFYATLAALAIGVILSAFRWAIIEPIHHRTGVHPPDWDFSRLDSNLAAYQAMVAQQLGLTRERVRQIESAGLTKLLHWQARAALEPLHGVINGMLRDLAPVLGLGGICRGLQVLYGWSRPLHKEAIARFLPAFSDLRCLDGRYVCSRSFRCVDCSALPSAVAPLKARIAELEAEIARLKKNSSTSSKPPSSDIVKPPRSAPAGGKRRGKRRRGGQPGHPRHTRPLFPPEQVDRTWIYQWETVPAGWKPLKRFRVVQQVELIEKP